MPRSAFKGDEQIELLVEENPRRVGSKRRRAFSRLQNEMTVNDYIAKLGHRGGALKALRHNIKAGFIQVR